MMVRMVERLRRIKRPSDTHFKMRPETPESSRQAHDDEALVERLLHGNEDAFEQFSAQHLGALYRFALTRLDHDEQLAQDIVQSTVATAFEKLEAYRGEGALFTWLCGICRFKIGAHFRARRRRPVEVALDDSSDLHAVVELLTVAGDSPEEELGRKEMANLVHLALDHLPARYGRALEWKYLEGLPVLEIAARLGIGAKAAESILSRARTAFRPSFQSLVESLDSGYRGLRLVTSQRSE